MTDREKWAHFLESQGVGFEDFPRDDYGIERMLLDGAGVLTGVNAIGVFLTFDAEGRFRGVGAMEGV